MLKAKIAMYEAWLREHVPDCPLLAENIIGQLELSHLTQPAPSLACWFGDDRPVTGEYWFAPRQEWRRVCASHEAVATSNLPEHYVRPVNDPHQHELLSAHEDWLADPPSVEDEGRAD